MSRSAAAVLATLLLLAPLALFAQAPICDTTCSPNTSSPSYGGTVAARPTLPNARGAMSPIVPRSGGTSPIAIGPGPKPPASDPVTKIPGSESYNYAIPILHLPGRNGLDLNLTLYYNSRVWTIDLANGTATLDGDRDWPSYGFRLNFGYLEYDATNGVYILTEADGTKRTLFFTATNSYTSNDGAYVNYNSGNKVLYYKNGLHVGYQAFPQSVICKLAGAVSTCSNPTNLFRPIWIQDTNGNAIGINYVDASTNTWSQGQEISTLTDTLGRTITFNYDASGKLTNITQGAKTWASFGWAQKTLRYSFSGLTVPSGSTPANNSSINVLASCTYPNGIKYSFIYTNQANDITDADWAIVTAITRQSSSGALRASVSYDFPAGTTTLNAHPSYTQQTVYDGVHTSTWNYNVVKSGSLVSSFSVTDPSSTKSVTTLGTGGGVGQGLVSQVQVQNSSGTPQRTLAYTWTTDPAGNPQIGTLLTTLNDSGQQAKVTYTYTTNGNVSEVDEYDYGLALKRKTLFTYLTAAPWGTTYHILDRVTQVLVKTPANAIVARTDLAYDTTTLSTVNGATHHDDANYSSTFTARGNLTSVTRYANAAAGSGAITRSLTYDSVGNLRSAQLDCCNQKSWAYSAGTQYAYPDSVTSGPVGLQLTTSATYNTTYGLVVSSTDANSKTTNFAYSDPMNRLTTVTRPDSVTTTLAYDDNAALASVTSSTSANSLQAVSTFDGAGRELQRDVRNGATVVSTVQSHYDILGRLTARTNPYAPGETVNSSSYAYDALGRVTTITPPSGGHSQFDYAGNAVTTTDPAGKQRRSFSDGLGRLVEVDEPGWGDGLPGKGSVTIGGNEGTGTIDPCLDEGMGRSCPQTVYDTGWVSITVNGLTKTADYLRGSTASGLATALANAFNADPSSTVSAGVSGSTVLLTAKLANASTDYPISAASDSTDTTGVFSGASFNGTPSGSTLTGARDPIIQAAPSLVTPMMTTYTYDLLDDLTGVSQAGLASVNGQQLAGQPRNYSYDSLGRLTSATTPETTDYNSSTQTYTAHAVSYTYTDFGAVATRTDARGIVATYSYDGLNRVTGVTYNDTPTTPPVTYAYGTSSASNNNGRLTSVTVGSGSPAESYTYDQLGRILTATESVDGTPYAVNYSYNPDNSLATIRYPSGRVVSQSYDAIGRLQSIADATTYLSGLSYNAAGQATAFNYGNGVAAAFTYNDHLELATLRYSKAGAADLLSLKYDYNQVVGGATVNNGQIQAVHFCTTEPVTCSSEDLTKTEQFSYDPWSRLSTAGTADNATWGLSWQYDRFGNRLQQNVTAGQAPAPSVTVDPATNRINSTGYVYDAAGNMTNDAANAYVYDAENRITSVNSGLATYAYLGALRVKRNFGGTTVYVYSGTVPIAEYVGGSLTKEYIYSGSQLLATIDASTGLSYQFPDHLSTRVEADASANVTRTFGHFPFGEVWYETGAASKWKFTSYERDSESGLDYADFRYYSSRLGRFMSADAFPGDIFGPESLDRFGYVQNDPVNAVDPQGLGTCFVLTFLDGAPEGPLCFWGASWIWFPIPIPGPANNGNGGGGGDPGSGAGAPPLRGERLGIPNGLRLPPANPLGALLPIDSGCDFGVCVPIGFQEGATAVLPVAVPVCVAFPEVCIIGVGAAPLAAQLYLLNTGALLLFSSALIKVIADRFCVDYQDLRRAVEAEKRLSGRGGADNLNAKEIKDIARTLAKIPGCVPKEE